MTTPTLAEALRELIALGDLKSKWELKYLRGQKPSEEDLAYESNESKARESARAALAAHDAQSAPCPQCLKPVAYLFPDSRCSACTCILPDEA